MSFNKMLVWGTPIKDFFKQERRPRVQWIVQTLDESSKWEELSGWLRCQSIFRTFARCTEHDWRNPAPEDNSICIQRSCNWSSRNVERKLFLFARHSLEQHLCTHQFLTWLLSKDLTSYIYIRPHISRESNRSGIREGRVLEQTSVK